MKRKPSLNLPGALAALGLSLFLFALILLLCGLALPAQYSETFLGEMPYKMDIIRNTPGKRIIVIGGSSVPFGINSQLMEEYLPDYSVVDFGLYADMGTLLMLDWAKPYLREGDIVIIAPEQNRQALSGFWGPEAVWQASDGAFRQISALPANRYTRLAAAFPAFAGKKLHYALLGSPVPEDVYARSSFNAWGDIAYPLRQANILPGGYDPNTPISFDESIITEDFTEALNNFARSAAAAGAKTFYHFSPMNASALAPETDAMHIDAYYDALAKRLLFPILGDPHKCLMDSGWFFDTNFHLNENGSIVFSKQLIEDIKLYLKDSSPTDIMLPQMPKPQTPVFRGDDSHAELLTYQETENGWVISGLRETAGQTSLLILPTTWHGKPVVAVSKDAFAGNKTLRTVTVQPNIGILPDGLFRGCSSMEKLILTGETPSAYAVGDGLREGADFLIHVPASALNAYRRGYSWQQYDAWLMAY